MGQRSATNVLGVVARERTQEKGVYVKNHAQKGGRETID